MTSASPTPEFAELLGRLTEEELSVDDWNRLGKILQESDEARRRYRQYVAVHGMLHWRERQAAPVMPPQAEAVDVANAPQRSTRTATFFSRSANAVAQAIEPGRHPFNFGLFTMACLLLCVFGFFALITPNWWGDPEYVASLIPQEEPLAADTRPLPYVARITDRSADRIWAPGQRRLAPHAHLQKGQVIRLASGLLEITFNDGAQVLLEGPAVLRLDSRGAGTLDRGKLVAHIPEAAIGFRVDTPAAHIVDLGTKFAVAVGDDKTTDVHLLEGEVGVHADGQRYQLSSRENSLAAGLSVDPHRRSVRRIAPDPTLFATNLRTYEIVALRVNDSQRGYTTSTSDLPTDFGHFDPPVGDGDGQWGHAADDSNSQSQLGGDNVETANLFNYVWVSRVDQGEDSRVVNISVSGLDETKAYTLYLYHVTTTWNDSSWGVRAGIGAPSDTFTLGEGAELERRNQSRLERVSLGTVSGVSSAIIVVDDQAIAEGIDNRGFIKGIGVQELGDAD